MSAIDNAASFGDIPFVDFTSGLITGVFDSLVESHMLQMEEYSAFVNSLTQDLSTYINNTKGDVPFDDVAEFVQAYELPKRDDATIKQYLDALDSPSVLSSDGTAATPANGDEWWGGLINALAPVAESLVEKIGGNEASPELEAITDYNQGIREVMPSYKDIHGAIASLLLSNKYGLLQTMAKQGMMRLIVTEGEIETKITFSTWNNMASGQSTAEKIRTRNKEKSSDVKKLGIASIFKVAKKNRTSNRTVTVNTAKSYQRDSSGTKVDIFGRVLIKFKTDYAPLNG
jgi:hypothetical protein